MEDAGGRDARREEQVRPGGGRWWALVCVWARGGRRAGRAGGLTQADCRTATHIPLSRRR